MPKPGDIHPTVSMVDTVNNAVGADNNLSDGRVDKFGHDTPHFGKVRQALGAVDQ